MNRFVFLTDSHYWPDAHRDFGAPKMLTHGRPIHDAVVPAINALSPDCVLHGGDFLCGGSAFDLPTETFERCVNEVRGFFNGIEAPFYLEAVPNPRGFGWKPDTDINLRHVM